MFCRKCGKPIKSSYGTCEFCGNLTSENHDLPVKNTDVDDSSSQKIFLDLDGILVTAAIFRTNTGVCYSIQNISSVSMETYIPSVLFSVFAGLLTFFGLLILISGLTAGLILMLLSTPLWYCSNQGYQVLLVCTGGMIHSAVFRREWGKIDMILQAINSAIIYRARK